MTLPRLYKVIGLMSGTSLDGIDVALIETDGLAQVKPLGFSYFPYEDSLRQRLRACFGARQMTPEIHAAEREMTLAHAEAVRQFLAAERLDSSQIDLVGFHGQTITHDPDHQMTWQLGDGDLLSALIHIPVVYDFRSQDVAAGGQGAPLIPIYHWARAFSSRLEFPVAILNIGGVSNVTWLGREEGDILAFDCGPGNALIDDLILRATGQRYDQDGQIAASGQADAEVLTRWLSHPFFAKQPPKSLDRDAWDSRTISNFPLPDAAATLTEFTVDAIVKGAQHFPEPAKSWYVTGGGRLNQAIMTGLARKLGDYVRVAPVEQLGWNGDAFEAEGFAYLAVRSLLGLPLSYPTTTGVKSPLSGGRRSK